MRDLRSFIVTCFAALAALAAWASPASAGETLNVQEWLARPGVRLVAVEFYATWCKPCMEAMPRWKALKEKYASQGLRVIVVNTQDPDGGCRALPFVPDETVCDLEGHVADSFKLQGKLPAAYLWSWQGNLLVSKGHIDQVEKAVTEYLEQAPRVVVEAAGDVPLEVSTLIRERLSDEGKVLVLAGGAEHAAIEAAKKAAQGAAYDERLACEIGKEVPPNTLLKVNRVAQGQSAYINLSLYDLRGGCLLAAASTEWSTDVRRMTQDVTAKLLGKLKRPEGMQSAVAREAEAPSQRQQHQGEGTNPPVPLPLPTEEPSGKWKRGAGWGSVGVGAALVATGGAFAFLAKKAGDGIAAQYSQCGSGGVCADQAKLDGAHSKSLIANVALISGGVASVLGIYWLLSAPGADEAKALRINVGPGFVGMAGSF